MLYQLSDCGICASSGSACTSGSLEPSHVLRAMKVPFTAVHGSVRFSFSRYNTDEDVDRIIEVFPAAVANLRRISPYWDQEANAQGGRGFRDPGNQGIGSKVAWVADACEFRILPFPFRPSPSAFARGDFGFAMLGL